MKTIVRHRSRIACLCALLILGALAPPARGEQPETPKRLKFASIIFQEDEFFRLIVIGMRDAAKKHNVELLEANSNDKPEKEFELVSTYIARKVDAILISPLSAKGSLRALKQAHDKGIKVVLFNTPLEDPTIYASCILNDVRDLGVQTGKLVRKYIQDKLGGKAKIAVIAYKTLLPEMSDGTVRGFKDQIADLPGVKIVSEQDAWMPETATKRVTDVLTANPDVNIVYAANEGGTIGSVLAVKNAGKSGKVAVFGTDANEQMLDFLLSSDNILQGITAEKPVEIGQQTIETALKVLKGEKVEKTVSLLGVPLSREDPETVRTYKKTLLEWIQKGTK
jgi:ABC-type sugar transport system substrate-binding protein